MTDIQIQQNQDALTRAANGQSVMNYSIIFTGFEAKGIAIADIHPRENVFTFNAWKALGRSVRKGQHGVKAVTFVAVNGKESDGDTKSSGFRIARTVTVFHISQTEVTA